MPNLQGSTPTGGGPTLRCFGEGRAVIIFPVEEGMGKSFDGKEDKAFIRCNIVALPDAKSAPYITYGGEVMQDGVTVKTPDTWRVDLGPHGWMAENVKIAGGGMLYILRAAMRSNYSARVGRLFKDPQHNYAWKLTDVDKAKLDNGAPNPGYEPELMQQAAWWLNLLQTQTFQNSYPVPIQQVPAQPAAPQQWAQPVQPQQPAPQGWGAPQSAPPAQQPAYAGPPPAQQGWGQPAAAPQGDPNAWNQQAQQPAPQGWGAPPPGWGPQQPAPAPQGDPNAQQVPHPGF